MTRKRPQKESPTHACVSHKARLHRGHLPSQLRVARRSHTERGSYTIEATECVLLEAPVTGSVCSWEAGVGLQPGGYSGSTSGGGEGHSDLGIASSSAGWWGLCVLTPPGVGVSLTSLSR